MHLVGAPSESTSFRGKQCRVYRPGSTPSSTKPSRGIISCNTQMGPSTNHLLISPSALFNNSSVSNLELAVVEGKCLCICLPKAVQQLERREATAKENKRMQETLQACVHGSAQHISQLLARCMQLDARETLFCCPTRHSQIIDRLYCRYNDEGVRYVKISGVQGR